jgi:hypothetical protein
MRWQELTFRRWLGWLNRLETAELLFRPLRATDGVVPADEQTGESFVPSRAPRCPAVWVRCTISTIAFHSCTGLLIHDSRLPTHCKPERLIKVKTGRPRDLGTSAGAKVVEAGPCAS